MVSNGTAALCLKQKNIKLFEERFPRKSLLTFIFNYMMLQRDAVDFMIKNNKVNPANPFIGIRTEKQVDQVVILNMQTG